MKKPRGLHGQHSGFELGPNEVVSDARSVELEDDRSSVEVQNDTVRQSSSIYYIGETRRHSIYGSLAYRQYALASARNG